MRFGDVATTFISITGGTPLAGAPRKRISTIKANQFLQSVCQRDFNIYKKEQRRAGALSGGSGGPEAKFAKIEFLFFSRWKYPQWILLLKAGCFWSNRNRTAIKATNVNNLQILLNIINVNIFKGQWTRRWCGQFWVTLIFVRTLLGFPKESAAHKNQCAGEFTTSL